MFKMKEYRDNHRSYGDLLGWFALVADGVCETTDGRMLAAWYFRGEDLASSTVDEMEALSQQLNTALCAKLDGRWSVHVDCIRSYTRGYPGRGAFPDRTTLMIDEERRVLYNRESAHMETIHALTLCWEMPTLMSAKLESWVYGDEAVSANSTQHHDRMLAKFIEACGDHEASLSGIVQLRRMKAYTDGVDHRGRPEVYDELLEYLEYCATGQKRTVRLPPVPVYIDRQIGAIGLRVEPLIANVGFGTGNVLRLGADRYVRTMTITGFPSGSQPAMLAVLDQLNFEYRWNTRFVFMDQLKAENVIKAERRKWKQKEKSLADQIRSNPNAQVDADAAAMVAETDQAMADLKSNTVIYGHYTACIVVMETDLQLLNDKVTEIENVLRARGFDSVKEVENSADAFIGSMPGNRAANVRGAPLHTLNLADLLPLTSVWAGHLEHPNPMYPPHSPPLFYAETSGGTPFAFCLHNDDVGHTLVLGPTGAGKTTLLNLMMAQHFRYPNARVFAFDRKYGSALLCKASGGTHYDVAGEGNPQTFCPLGSIETAQDLAWATEWLESCCVLQGVEVTPGRRQSIYDALVQMKDQDGGRSMTNLVGLVQDSAIQEALRFYTVAGPMGMLLDGETDDLRSSRFMCFEMEHLAEMGEKSLVPVLLYLFREIERRMDARYPTLVTLDESWLALTHAMFKDRVLVWLKTWRSKNAAVVLATQEPSDVLNSTIRDTALASCPTRVLLPNPDAGGVQREMYNLLGCNDTEIEIIKGSTKKRHYYYKSPVGRRLISLGLGNAALRFLGGSSRQTLDAARELESEHGETWPAAWLRAGGVDDWATYWERVQ